MFLNHLYGGMDEPEPKITDVFVCKLRKKLAQATGGSHYIETVWGCGYVLRELAEGPAAAPVAGAEDLAAPHDRADNAPAAECTVTEAVRPTPGGAALRPAGPFRLPEAGLVRAGKLALRSKAMASLPTGSPSSHQAR